MRLDALFIFSKYYKYFLIQNVQFHLGCLQSTLSLRLDVFETAWFNQRKSVRYLHHYRRYHFLRSATADLPRAAIRYTWQTLFSAANTVPFMDSITCGNAVVARAAVTGGPGI